MQNFKLFILNCCKWLGIINYTFYIIFCWYLFSKVLLFVFICILSGLEINFFLLSTNQSVKFLLKQKVQIQNILKVKSLLLIQMSYNQMNALHQLDLQSLQEQVFTLIVHRSLHALFSQGHQDLRIKDLIQLK